jgi:hypothetical protein
MLAGLGPRSHPLVKSKAEPVGMAPSRAQERNENSSDVITITRN